jgi:hypothetical protein
MLKRALLVVVSLAVLCVTLEVLLRTAHLFHARLSWTEPDRHIGWRFTPGREYWFFGENDHAITGRINSMGWRDRERSVEKPPHTYRIAVIGDSYVEAFQVEQDSTSEGRLEVLNFGRSGMCPAEECIMLGDAMRSHPDEIVLLFTPQNDIADVNLLTASDPCRPFFFLAANGGVRLDQSFAQRRDFRIRELINPLKQHSALVSLVVERFNAWRQARTQRRVAASASHELTREQRMCTSHPVSVYVANYTLCKALIRRMARSCAGSSIRFRLASVPLVYLKSDVEKARTLDPSFDPLFFDRDLGVMADSSGFAFTPLTQAFTDRSRDDTRLHWQHWNYAGHRLAATLLIGLPGR